MYSYPYKSQYPQKNPYQPKSYIAPYLPKRPVKSFQDLEVYQKALEASVFVSKHLLSPRRPEHAAPGEAGTERADNGGAESSPHAQDLIFKNMLPCALGIPHLIAEAHSYRFGSQNDCIVLLEKVMVNCNKMIVYAEQVRDICSTGVSKESFDDLIKKYFYIRRKVLNLQRSWKKFMHEKKQEPEAEDPL